MCGRKPKFGVKGPEASPIEDVGLVHFDDWTVSDLWMWVSSRLPMRPTGAFDTIVG